jgi:hypothetical protein
MLINKVPKFQIRKLENNVTLNALKKPQLK